MHKIIGCQRRSIKLHRSYPLENRRNAKQERQDYIESVAHCVRVR